MYEPAVPEHDSVEVPLAVVMLSVILGGETVHARPIEGEIVMDREIVAVRPWRPVSVIVEPPDAPAKMATLVVSMTIVKSWTV